MPRGLASPARLRLSFLFFYFNDWFTTRLLIQHGGHEANRFLTNQTLPQLLGLKLIVLPFLLALLYAAGRVTRAFEILLLLALNAWFLGLCIWNLYLTAT